MILSELIYKSILLIYIFITCLNDVNATFFREKNTIVSYLL
jgi:hypothetical protein